MGQAQAMRRWWWRSDRARRARLVACRIGLHFMAFEFVADCYACACRRSVLPMEGIRHGDPS